MVSHPKTPILNCSYHLMWFYLFNCFRILLLREVIFCVWPDTYAPHS